MTGDHREMPDELSGSGMVSVIVPVFNVEAYLTQCLSSIMSQTYPHLEIILVNDGSTDGSADIIHQFVESDDRFIEIHQNNAGVSTARNTGLDAATGEFAMFVDADDWIETHAVELMINKIANGNLDIVTCGYFIDYPDRSLTGHSLAAYDGILDTARGIESILAGPQRFAVTRLYRRSVIGATRFREDIHWGEDTIFAVEVARDARASAVVDEPLYHYVQSTGSATRSTWNPRLLTGPKMTEVLEELVQDKYPHLVDYVLQTRINTMAILIQDVAALPRQESRDLVRKFSSLMRADLPRMIRADRISKGTKFKAMMLALSPRGFIASRRLLQAVRKIRD